MQVGLKPDLHLATANEVRYKNGHHGIDPVRCSRERTLR
jgi:hypothetical protein